MCCRSLNVGNSTGGRRPQCPHFRFNALTTTGYLVLTAPAWMFRVCLRILLTYNDLWSSSLAYGTEQDMLEFSHPSSETKLSAESGEYMIHCSSSVVRRLFTAALVFPLLLGTALAGPASAAKANENVGPLRTPGIDLKNFGNVDGRIYRGEQPGSDDYQALARLGVTTVIDLRLDAKKNSRGRAEAAGLKYVNIPIDDHRRPTDDHVTAFLKTLDENQTAKVYVHCAGGRHRTGSMLAVYRMVRNGWTLEQAYSEMLAYDFYTRFGHKGFKSFVEEYWQQMSASPTAVPAPAVQVAR